MDEPLVWLGAAVAALLAFYFIERSGVLGTPCACAGADDSAPSSDKGLAAAADMGACAGGGFV